MEKILLMLLTVLTIFTSAYASPPRTETSDSNGETNEFWPPDLIPHPHPSGGGPSGPSEPEMV